MIKHIGYGRTSLMLKKIRVQSSQCSDYVHIVCDLGGLSGSSLN